MSAARPPEYAAVMRDLGWQYEPEADRWCKGDLFVSNDRAMIEVAAAIMVASLSGHTDRGEATIN